ncbi:UNVERIFIED_CONTAM: hypothetical protein FKN15_001479 [Acipenser sinensis]
MPQVPAGGADRGSCDSFPGSQYIQCEAPLDAAHWQVYTMYFKITLSICYVQVYDLQYKVLIDGEERDSLMEIDSANRIEVFRTGNGSEEVLEIHDFKNGITGIRFAKHQKCYIRTQTKELPNITELESGDAVGLVFLGFNQTASFTGT